MGGLPGQDITLSLPIKLSAPLDQFPDPKGPFVDQNLDRFRSAEAFASQERVRPVCLNAVIRVQRNRDPALGKFRGALRGISFVDDQHPTVVSQVDRSPNSGDPAADDKEIG
jgi:hypothetical protein